MSVQANTYVMTGVVLPYMKQDGLYEKLEPYMDSAFKGIHHHKGICVVFDGMNGKYIVIGRVHAKTENHQGLDGVHSFDTPSPDIRELIAAAASDLIGQDISPADVKPLVLTHYR